MMKLRKLWIVLICFGLVLGGGVFQAADATSKKIIIQVQTDLQTLGYYHGKITGALDKDTKEAVKAFQKEHGLKVDGIPGKKTRKALKKALKEKTSMEYHFKLEQQLGNIYAQLSSEEEK